MKVAVVGAGGIGGYFGGRLAVAGGHEVRFVARGRHLAALRRDGLTVDGPSGSFSVPPEDLRATEDPGDIGAVDFVLLGVKTWQLPSAIGLLKPLTGAGTAVVTTQNGVETPVEVAEAVGREAVVPGSAKIITYLEGPGRVRHIGGLGSLTFGEWDNRPSERVEGLRQALDEAGVAAVVPQDIWAELWAKFLFVAPLGGVGAATDAPIGALRSRPGTRRLLADAMAEIQQVAQASGIALPDDIVARTLDFVDQQPAEGTSSLQRDIGAGKASELEAWTGSVVRLGARSGTPTPVNGFLYEVLSLREARAREQRGEGGAA
ncbi:2-dehydropantoate 2-reductase [Streptomyces sp. A3M-1-3]|uniref:2-dehydropantoate 2-reductase n=1 Tax=Streptomyces sp. A3M-1-3 TaxID=2962044 RepID=UPI0020B8A9D3|nr:2-dehydropantoate 2-reductase [Streptomyces sp. A3M-1-3]MCP3819188.1 2-dehydropantoate 2-reductase [Streptomyces sp. A3M-1-3]